MSEDNKKVKNLKISEEVHEILKTYCDKRGIKIYRFLEKLIVEKSKATKSNGLKNLAENNPDVEKSLTDIFKAFND